jgi:methionine biosynthesis protein MetW
MSGRPDWDIIVDLIPAGMRVLDLGCGNGELLAQLLDQKPVVVRGVENNEDNVRACVARGLSVRHGDIEEGLADFADGSWDYAILSQTMGCLQRPLPVLTELLRVARFVIVSFQNAGYWKARIRASVGLGAGPELTSGFPLTRSITLAQFRKAVVKPGAEIKARFYLAGAREVQFWPELRAQTIVAVLGQNHRGADKNA